ncbi:hypothetical protein Fmac_001988 [Flemingia macrophylla]|uniref:glucose-6-phosphate 1-epimerase n=1 Tax=Flemingia macrophylla TaxID=520843 RepID=A0ABD1NKC2_9FABA
MDNYILQNTRGASLTVSCQGARILSWKSERGEELLFTSSKAVFDYTRPVQGGIAICFPQFRKQGTLEQYGFAREKIWCYEKDPPLLAGDFNEKECIDLLLKPTPENDLTKIWPHRDVRVEGLEFRDYLDNLLQNKRFTEQGNALTFESEVDRVYIETNNVTVFDHHHQTRKTFTIRKEGLPDIVVWNPWKEKSRVIEDFGDEEYNHMVCVDAASLENPITLEPGQEWTGRLELSLRNFC